MATKKKARQWKGNYNAQHNTLPEASGGHSGIHVMVSVLHSRLSSSGSSPGRGHEVVFLGKTCYSHHSGSLYPGTV